MTNEELILTAQILDIATQMRAVDITRETAAPLDPYIARAVSMLKTYHPVVMAALQDRPTA